MRLGRDADCEIRITGNQVSRQHAELTWEGSTLWITDTDSTNGVQVDGCRVQRAKLGPGSLLRLGQCIGVVVSAQPEQTPRASSPEATGMWVGEVLERAIEPVRRVAETDLPIVVEGETGTGKELAARAVHHWSKREGAFVAVNCATIPEALAEAELFGYRKGAFTGADRASPGHFRFANGGTLLLDEVIDLPLSAQAKLLRVLEQREVVPLGESKPYPVDVRIVTAAQRPLIDFVREGRFRSDLYARLAGVTVRLPPLRERVVDVPGLLHHLLTRHSTGAAPALDAEFVEALCLHDWPFNIRELDLLVRRLLALHPNLECLRAEHLDETFLHSRVTRGGDECSKGRPNGGLQVEPPLTLEQEIEKLREGLERFSGNVAKAAQFAGISRPRAYRVMNTHKEQVAADPYRARRPPR